MADAEKNTASPQAEAVIHDDFLAHRAKLLDIAAYLDRAERYGVDDHKLGALRSALTILADDQPERTQRLLLYFSDHSTQALDQIPKHPVSGVNNESIKG